MTALGRQVWALVIPAVAWAVHFIAIYALISAACAPRNLIDVPLMMVLGVVATVFCGIAALWPTFRPPHGDGLTKAVRVGGLIFLLAIVFDVLPLVFSSGCGG